MAPGAKVGTFTQGPCEEAKKLGWVVISISDQCRVLSRFTQGATSAA